MTLANVKLSKAELTLVCDEQIILTKNIIIDKVYQLFGVLNDHFITRVKNTEAVFPLEVLTWSPKIYRGEQYRGLPYVMLDYPRYFIKDDAFAIRCLFWWGKFFSITLHLGGKFALKHSSTILKSMRKKENSSWYICINKDPWQHHFEIDNYLPASDNALTYFNKKTIQEKSFFKIAKKMPLQKWSDSYDFFVSGYNEILDMLIDR
ncbi:MAG TPA: hypothetical protein VH396_10465 [Chitinophagaceae bacterium]|jgi:hypothetical protein